MKTIYFVRKCFTNNIQEALDIEVCHKAVKPLPTMDRYCRELTVKERKVFSSTERKITQFVVKTIYFVRKCFINNIQEALNIEVHHEAVKQI